MIGEIKTIFCLMYSTKMLTMLLGNLKDISNSFVVADDIEIGS